MSGLGSAFGFGVSSSDSDSDRDRSDSEASEEVEADVEPVPEPASPARDVEAAEPALQPAPPSASIIEDAHAFLLAAGNEPSKTVPIRETSISSVSSSDSLPSPNLSPSAQPPQPPPKPALSAQARSSLLGEMGGSKPTAEVNIEGKYDEEEAQPQFRFRPRISFPPAPSPPVASPRPSIPRTAVSRGDRISRPRPRMTDMSVGTETQSVSAGAQTVDEDEKSKIYENITLILNDSTPYAVSDIAASISTYIGAVLDIRSNANPMSKTAQVDATIVALMRSIEAQLVAALDAIDVAPALIRRDRVQNMRVAFTQVELRFTNLR